MRLPVICVECLEINGLKTAVRMIPFPHDFILDFTCDQNHTNIHYVQEADWELLITSGGIALSEGYPMEAVSAIAAGIERFMEFALRVICKSFGVADAMVDSGWKHVKPQSERQFGAFAFLYLVRFNAEPPTLPGQQVQFRNSVIHTGRLPKPEEVEAYGDAVMNLIFKVHDKLQESHGDALTKTHFDQVQERVRQARERGGERGISIPSFFRVVLDDPAARKSFKQAVTDHEIYRRH